MTVVEMQVRSKVEALLKDFLGHWEMDDDHDYVVRNESAVVFIRVASSSSGDTCMVNIFSPVATQIPNMKQKTELAGMLLDSNAGVYFGKFGWREVSNGGMVVCEQAILGSSLDKDSFNMALSAVATRANEIDDEIVARFGGKRWID